MISSLHTPKLTLVTIVLLSSVLLTGCVKSSSTNTGAGSTQVPAAEEKRGDTTITGKISGSNGSFFIQESGQAPKAIESYSVELDQYVGQTITVTGQYSGDTLFVGSVQSQ